MPRGIFPEGLPQSHQRRSIGPVFPVDTGSNLVHDFSLLFACDFVLHTYILKGTGYVG